MKTFRIQITIFSLLVISFFSNSTLATTNIAQYPLFLTAGVPPIVMLTMGRDHKLYYEAYNDASDLNDDGELDIRYKPTEIDYFGYFDSYKCYNYSSNLFTPASVTANKQCSGNWSGDFLNYITTSRIDALRKVLYGGYRSTDSTSGTILKRSFIPQDAHSWGKEYTSIAVDGYDISNYTPLGAPTNNTRHLFANVSLSDSGQPLMRVLDNSIYRIWEWVSIEGPVAGSSCDSGIRLNCVTSGGTTWLTVPSTVLSNLSRSTYDLSGTGFSHPIDHSEFDTLVTNYAVPGLLDGTGLMTTIEGTGNPYGSNDNYLTVITGNITVPTAGTYQFSVDGDDAVEVLIDGNVVAGFYGAFGFCNCNAHNGSVLLTAGSHTIEYRHEEEVGLDGFILRWAKTVPSSSITDYSVNVKVCDTNLLEANCKAYSDGNTTTYKPIGILQRYGDDELMAFGLLSGSFTNNISGGVIRKNISSFQDEIDLDTGIFTNTSGIIDTIDKLQIAAFNYSGKRYDPGWPGAWNTTGPIVNGEAPDWGNPIAEMMYEGLRYFAGKSGPTSVFNSGVSAGTSYDSTLGLPLPSWQDPYRPSGGYEYCAKPIQLVISDINPSYDTDQLPGSYFSSFSGDLSGMNVSALADTIWAGESEASNVFIGQSGATSDGSPSPKTVTSFRNIRGLAPEEPTKLGGYYAGSVALYGKQTDLHTVTSDQNVDTLAVALASPLPRIEIPVDGKTVTLVPFAKSVGGCLGITPTQGNFQPTNQIVDFYVETIVNTGAGNADPFNGGRPYGKFRINFEDVEQAADHDMDAIAEYEFLVNASNEVVVTLNSTYASGCIQQHMGYIISGTTQDGTYLEVKDAEAGDSDFFLDTPPGQLPGGAWNDSVDLPTNISRTFTAGATASASFIKHDPLWYAAKWSMTDENNNGTLDADEWDSDSDGDPDGYFLVTNAGKLDQQLNKAFEEIVSRTSSGAAVATNSTRLDTNTKIYQARFNSSNWSGQLLAFDLDDVDGTIGAQAWDAATLIPSENSRTIYSYNPLAAGSKGIAFEYANLNPAQKALLDMDHLATVDSLGESRVDYIRGDQTKEIANSGGVFRDRTSLMGDIVNSDPWFVGRAEDFGYSNLPGTEGSSYITYRNNKRSRTPALYFGANEGMLHAINADSGAEIFTYVPDSVISSLNKLTSPLYGCTGSSGCLSHTYFVDGAAKAADAYINSDWKTILVGTLAAGGKGLFALDISHPSSFTASKIMWEISTTHAPNSGDLSDFQNDLGYTFAQASVVRMHNDKWAAIVSNGYDSTNDKAVLFIIDIETGEIMEMFDTEVGSGGTPNGLSTPIPVDEDGDRIVDSIYAGDLQGNMWKIDVTATNSNSWDFAFKQGNIPKPLFIAKDGNDVVQPITSKPQVGKHPDGGVMVYFGTGQYYAINDEVVGNTPQVQTFYGIRDVAAEVSSRSDLQEQTIIHEATLANLHLDIRVTSDTPVNYTGNSPKSGWYMDLESPVNGPEGERVVSAPLLRGGRVIFATLIPESNPCGWGGSSWLMEIDAVNGQRLSTSPFDIDEDGDFDEDDLLAIADTNNDGVIDGNDDQVEISGIRKHDVGIIKTPGVVSTGNDTEVKYVSGSSGNLEVFFESAGEPFGRQSWRQLR